MKVLILDKWFHHKNKIGIIKMFEKYGVEFEFVQNLEKIKDYSIIYSPSVLFDSSIYPDKKFIFGPHVSVFPDNRLSVINNKYNNSCYIQPSLWAKHVWDPIKNILPVFVQPFPVDTDRFKPLITDRTKVFVYFKCRKNEELNAVIQLLSKLNIDFEVFNYNKKYNEEDYLLYLQQSKFGIIVGRHESQGFAIEEALSCNVPLLVWNTRSMNQEEGCNYQDIKATTIPYWSDLCGEYFYDEKDLEQSFNLFISKLSLYKPREYILNNLDVDKCFKIFTDNINKLM